jgi:hypothetical protein
LESISVDENVLSNLSALSPLANSPKLKELWVYLIPLEQADMALLESLPNLQKVCGLNLQDQSDPSWLDRFFDSCGKTLRTL